MYIQNALIKMQSIIDMPDMRNFIEDIYHHIQYLLCDANALYFIRDLGHALAADSESLVKYFHMAAVR